VLMDRHELRLEAGDARLERGYTGVRAHPLMSVTVSKACRRPGEARARRGRREGAFAGGFFMGQCRLGAVPVTR
jgi:hypothetical protein